MAACKQTGTDKHPCQFSQHDQHVSQALCEFRDAVKAVQGLHCPLDDSHLLKFLRAKKFDMAKSLKLIINFYKMRKEYINIQLSILPYELHSEIWMRKIITVLKNRDTLGRQVLVVRIGLWDPSEFPFDAALMCSYYVLEELIAAEDTQKNGLVYVWDFAGLGLNQSRKILWALTLQRIRLTLQLSEGSYPARFKEIHVLDKYYIFKVIFSIIKPFQSEKMRRRVYTHSDVTSLHKVVNPNILPKSLGGILSDNDAKDEEVMSAAVFSAKQHNIKT